MIRGTDAKFKFKLTCNCSELESATITFWQKDNNGPSEDRPLPIIKVLSQCTQADAPDELYVELNEEETLRFSDDRKAYVQLITTTVDGTSTASREKMFTVYPIYDEAMLGDDVHPTPGYTPGGVVITVDTALSTTSENPVQNKVITQNLNEIEQSVSALNDEIAALINRFDGNVHMHPNLSLLDYITPDKIEAWDAGERNVIALVDETQFAVDDERMLILLDVTQDKISGLVNAEGNTDTLANILNEKVNKVEGSRLITISEAEKLEKLIITEDGNVGIDGVIRAENVVGLAELLAEKVDAIEGMGLSTNDFTDALLTKLNAIDFGAEPNNITDITLGGTPLIPIDRVVDIPIATTEKYGAVKLSVEVGVDENNALEIKKLNVNKLEQDEGSSLILDSGSSNV